MKKFNLELALAGHPLVTRAGNDITQFFPTDTTYVYACIHKGDNCVHMVTRGGCAVEIGKSRNDVFLTDADWKPELKMGDIIEIKFPAGWADRIFVKHGASSGVLFVDNSSSGDFKGDKAFLVRTSKNGFWRIKPNLNDLEVKFTLNGEDFDASELSHESLLMLIAKIKK